MIDTRITAEHIIQNYSRTTKIYYRGVWWHAIRTRVTIQTIDARRAYQRDAYQRDSLSVFVALQEVVTGWWLGGRKYYPMSKERQFFYSRTSPIPVRDDLARAAADMIPIDQTPPF